jgi:hypothetical protein
VELARSTAHYAGKCPECKGAAGMSMVVEDAALLRTTMGEGGTLSVGSRACLAKLAAKRLASRTARKSRDALDAADEADDADDSPDAHAQAMRTFRPFLELEARGCEITGWEVGDGYAVESALPPPPGMGRTVLEDVDLADGEWVEYDDHGNGPLEIMGVETRVVKCK